MASSGGCRPVRSAEEVVYEVLWRTWARGAPFPLPWWAQQCFRRWVDGARAPFSTREDALCSDALYRYWHMVGVKDAEQECLVGQAGELEPVRERYAVGFFVFDPRSRELGFPQHAGRDAGRGARLVHALLDGYLPVVETGYRSPLGMTVTQRAFAVPVGDRARSLTVARLVAEAGAVPAEGWLCMWISPLGPTGLHRRFLDGGGQDRRLGSLRYLPDTARIQVGAAMGPLFDPAPGAVGIHGNPTGDDDPDRYLADNPFAHLAATGGLSGVTEAMDPVAGLCVGALAWPFALRAGERLEVDVRLPTDDFRGEDDIAELRRADLDALEQANLGFWRAKLDREGVQARLPGASGLWDLFRACRSQILILADGGQIHPGPSVYDSFWVRDSSVEGVASALAGDLELPRRQFGVHYPGVLGRGPGRIGPVAEAGFIGGGHERDAHEWDGNGEALWAIGRFDRITAPDGFGAAMFAPFVLDGARWIRDNRGPFGLLPSGWSAEHLGEMDRPHYWDDLWAVAGLYEAASLARRIGAREEDELWSAYDDVRRATTDSVRWALDAQRAQGHWETFIPTGPADVGRLDSTIIGAVAYFHPCRLYMGEKLGPDVDRAARLTLETVWAHFVRDGGFRHDAAWGCYGPYLTLQLAHAFLLTGDLDRSRAALGWASRAARARVDRPEAPGTPWDVALSAWGEQHCYPVASDFAEVPGTPWYMGDMPHGWAAAELMLLVRDMLLFEADEDGARHLYVGAGIPAAWLDGGGVEVRDAPTLFGSPVGYRIARDAPARTVTIEMTRPPPADVGLVYRCDPGEGVVAALADGRPAGFSGRDVRLPPGTHQAVITYAP